MTLEQMLGIKRGLSRQIDDLIKIHIKYYVENQNRVECSQIKHIRDEVRQHVIDIAEEAECSNLANHLKDAKIENKLFSIDVIRNVVCLSIRNPINRNLDKLAHLRVDYPVIKHVGDELIDSTWEQINRASRGAIYDLLWNIIISHQQGI